jgi:hypothetical protein
MEEAKIDAAGRIVGANPVGSAARPDHHPGRMLTLAAAGRALT